MQRSTIAALAPLFFGLASACVSATTQPASREHAAALPEPSRDDPAVLRREITSRYEARLDELVTRARLDLRLTLDEVLPVPYLGVDVEPVENGLRATAVYADTGAERAGIRIGDVLARFAGRALESKATLGRSVRAQRVGDEVELAVLRDGRELALRVVLGPRPEEDEDEVEQFPDLATKPFVPAPLAFSFDDEAADATPRAFFAALGGHGAPADWRVAAAEHGRVLRQCSTDPTGIRFPQALVRDWSAADVVARVRFRFAAGRVDRAAGIVLRWRDADDYLVARVNAAEHDVRIFRVVHGDRRTLPGAIAQVATDDGAWHELEFRALGAELTATVDGTATAKSYDTFFERGAVGLWTKSDSVTEFDDFRAEATR
jgi:hypothetical protein